MPARSRVASWLHAMTGMTAPRRFAGLARAVGPAALARLTAAPPCAAVADADPAKPTDASTTAVRAIHERMRCSPAICGRAALKVDLIMVMYLCRCRPGRDRRLLQTASASGWGQGTRRPRAHSREPFEELRRGPAGCPHHRARQLPMACPPGSGAEI